MKQSVKHRETCRETGRETVRGTDAQEDVSEAFGWTRRCRAINVPDRSDETKGDPKETCTIVVQEGA